MKQLFACLFLTVCVGCSAPKLPYRPVAEGPEAPVSAAHERAEDRFYVYVASEGRRVASAKLTKADGTQLTPVRIHHPAQQVGGFRQVGVGGRAGIGSFGNRGGLGLSVGSSTSSDYGQTMLVFRTDQVGPGPWRLTVQVAGFPAVDIELPAFDPPQP